MMSTGASPKFIPQLVKLDKALKLAETWVDNMSATSMDELNETQFQGRPSRLGLGANVMHQSRATASVDPVEKKLRAKLNAEKKQATKNLEESGPTEKMDGDSEEDKVESRTSAFAKKRKIPSAAASLQAKRKKKMTQHSLIGSISF